MIFRYPLERRGFYYMDKSTYLQIMANREERAVFFLILRELAAEIRACKQDYLITINNKK